MYPPSKEKSPLVSGVFSVCVSVTSRSVFVIVGSVLCCCGVLVVAVGLVLVWAPWWSIVFDVARGGSYVVGSWLVLCGLVVVRVSVCEGKGLVPRFGGGNIDSCGCGRLVWWCGNVKGATVGCIDWDLVKVTALSWLLGTLRRFGKGWLDICLGGGLSDAKGGRDGLCLSSPMSVCWSSDSAGEIMPPNS